MRGDDAAKKGLRAELLRRRDADQAGRAAFDGRDPDELRTLMEMDDDNAAWLAELIDRVGWPGRTLVGEEGSHAAWLLAQHADRYPQLQARCLELMKEAVDKAEALEADMAHLMDRVLLASGKMQRYGTQVTARDGRFVPSRLSEPESVNERRATAGLDPIEVYLARTLAHRGPPRPLCMQCPACNARCEAWMPEMGGRSRTTCPSCGYVISLRLRMRPGAVGV